MSERVVLVTGAGGGLGQAIVRALSTEGAAVALQYHSNRDAVAALAAELERGGTRALIVQGDLAQRAGPAAVCREVLAQLGRVDILVNNAGSWVDKPLLDTTDDEWDRLLHTDLRATYLMIRELAPGMVQRGWGRIINMSSVASLNYVPGEGLYGIVKAGINHLTKSFGVELAPCGVTVNAVAPAWTVPHDQPFPLPEDYPQCADAPNKRPGHANEVAALVRYLASDEAGHITGHILPIDGGLSSVIAKGR